MSGVDRGASSHRCRQATSVVPRSRELVTPDSADEVQPGVRNQVHGVSGRQKCEVLDLKEAHRLKSGKIGCRPFGLQKMAARKPKLAKRPKFLMSDPDGSWESLRNVSGASLGAGHFLPAVPFSSILGPSKWTHDQVESTQFWMIGLSNCRSRNKST